MMIYKKDIEDMVKQIVQPMIDEAVLAGQIQLLTELEDHADMGWVEGVDISFTELIQIIKFTKEQLSTYTHRV